MGLNLETTIGRLKLKNPVLVASGTFGHAREFEKIIDLKRLGGIVTKTITLKPRLGNPPVRIVETPAGMLNAIGLQNPGVEKFIGEKLPYLRKIGIPIIVSVMGHSVEEFVKVVGRLESEKGFDGYELNLSCPNVRYGASATKTSARMFAHDAVMIKEVVSAVRKMTQKTLIAKLGPDVSDIGAMALAAEEAGADAVSLINTFVAMAIDVEKRRPVLGNITGGLSGPCVRPIAVRMTWEVHKRVKIPLLGMGGIMDARDALEFLIAGASAIQVGTANFMNPRASVEILEGLRAFMKKEKIGRIQNLIGSLNSDE
ncbi:MAG: dihydroorotate dehydrogenase [Candidatus Omnitrophica bacterium]|nr:dihydroorotate dehydrogenase [Candidatus Omnitrophota bacterium]